MADGNAIYTNIANKWSVENRGVGSINLLKPLSPETLIATILSRMLAKNPEISCLICVKDYRVRPYVFRALEKANITNFQHITFLTESYATKYYSYHVIFFMDINTITSTVENLVSRSKFNLFIITDKISTEESMRIYKLMPPIDVKLNTDDLVAINMSSPVKEERVGCVLSATDAETYAKYTEYINDSISIFGDIDTILAAGNGNTATGQSAEAICNRLAADNGWNVNLDMSFPFNQEIDRCFNPNSIKDRAATCLDVMRKRKDFISSNSAKLDVILDIAKANPNARIIIISKKGEFANAITDYLNINGVSTGGYHSDIPKTMLVNEYGVPVLYKSGAKKGQPREVGAAYISSANLALYLNGDISVLSLKNSSDSALQCDCDLWIVTSPFCDKLFQLRYRFSGVVFNRTPNHVYKLFMQDTIEEKKLKEDVPNRYTEIITKIVKSDVITENNGGIVCE